MKKKKLTEKQIKALPDNKFEAYTREQWAKWENTPDRHPEDSIPFWEYLSEMKANYNR